jgi:hypothetical protein
LFILNLFPGVRWLIQHFTKKSCNIWEWPYDGKDWGNGRTVGCSIMTMRPTTQLSPSVSFWQIKTFSCYCNQPTLLTYHHMISGCSPESRIQWKGSNLTQINT